MTSKNKAQQEIDDATALFEKDGGKVEQVEVATPAKKSAKRQRLAEIRAKKQEMNDEEKALREEINAGKAERKEARTRVNDAKEAFEEARKSSGNAMKVVNSIHLTKSVQKHFDDFNNAIAELLLRQGKMEEAAKAYLQAIRDYKEL